MANLELQCAGPALVTCDRLEEVHQHLLGNVLAQHQALHHGVVIVEAGMGRRSASRASPFKSWRRF
jgi:hypothetical protein